MELKGVLKKLVSKTQEDSLHMEETILKRIKKAQLSRGWSRVSGVKLAPLKVLSQA